MCVDKNIIATVKLNNIVSTTYQPWLVSVATCPPCWPLVYRANCHFHNVMLGCLDLHPSFILISRYIYFSMNWGILKSQKRFLM